MSRRRKLEKFAELLTFPNVYEMSEVGSTHVKTDGYNTIEIAGRWGEVAFNNTNPICLELTCGRGEYTLALARRYPEVNFIGVDIKGARIWQGASVALEEKLPNVAFLRIRIEQITDYFAPDEIAEMWITFPDPFHAKENRRTTCAAFLDRYVNVLQTGGKINLKTDDPDFYEYSVESISAHKHFDIVYKNDDIYKKDLYTQDLDIKTYYEMQHLSVSKTIKYLLFEKNN